MSHLIKAIKQIVPVYVTTNHRRLLSLLQRKRIKLPQIRLKSPMYFIPGSFVLPTVSCSLNSEVTQFDVEENIGHLMTLARIALEKGEVDKAEAILEMGIKICEEYQTYFAMSYMYDILASISFAMGNYNRAETLLVQVIEKMIQLGVPEYDTQIVDFKLRLSRIYSVKNENTLAEIGFRNCLRTQETKIENGDTSTKTGMLYINSMFWYSLHKVKNNEYKTAKKLIDDAYSYSTKIKGLSPYQEMIILYTLADLNTQMEEFDVALQNMQSAILLGKGIGSLDLPKCYLKLGKIYIKLGSTSVAEHWLTEASTLADLFNDREVYEDAEATLREITDGTTYFSRTTKVSLKDVSETE
ncbi:unnamed protein product [Callosobruchus maculatus]|uniref:Uncharacterized protein n=2 Tax=Callosobruchus maculatus TaxID=64391 RepID=A0A653DCB1_CALMS|nr:unnamed protein product [Callosobruchus maculatus]